MKTKLLTVLCIIAVAIVGCKNSNRKVANAETSNIPDKISLFNGTFDNWVFCLEDDTDPATVFTITNDSIISIKGQPFGYMRTDKSYSNYKLHAEYRWVGEPSNSGLFVHHQLPDKVWPVCIENQLAAGRAGMFVMMNGASINEADPEQVASGAEFVIVSQLAESSEKAAGEWNVMEVICQDDNITTYVNGVLQNKGTGSFATEGRICLQSEGGPLQFKNIYIEYLGLSK